MLQIIYVISEENKLQLLYCSLAVYLLLFNASIICITLLPRLGMLQEGRVYKVGYDLTKLQPWNWFLLGDKMCTHAYVV